MKSWYSRHYLGKSFDRFLSSEMKLSDFTRLQEELQRVSVQLQELDSFIENGSRNRTGKTRTRIEEVRET